MHFSMFPEKEPVKLNYFFFAGVFVVGAKTTQLGINECSSWLEVIKLATIIAMITLLNYLFIGIT